MFSVGTTSSPGSRSSRHDFLALAGGGLAALVLPGAVRAAGTPGGTGTAGYYTRPDLRPPLIEVATSGPGVDSGLIFLAPFAGPSQYGPLIVDNAGEPVWFRPSATLSSHNFRVQRLHGKPVLTWWEGELNENGFYEGECVIVNTSYQVLKRLETGYITEEHEFVITSRNTALISAINPVPMDLSPYGGGPGGTLIEGVVQEIDIGTGKVLLTWHGADHVTPDESYIGATSVWDYLHLNSIGVDTDGNLLVSARHTSAVYKIDRTSGEVIWRLGGKKSDFTLGPGAAFAFQHDARGHRSGLVSIFDDGAYSPASAIESTSRAIVLSLDTHAMTATLVRAMPNPHGSLATLMGNAQLLSDGGWFVGWGGLPEYSEFSPMGELRYDASLTDGGFSYRAFRNAWKASPTTRPNVAASGNADGTTDVFASWNGATEVSHWRFFGGPARNALRPLRTVPRSGFETSVRLAKPPAYVAVDALDTNGHTLATSPTSRA
jgi:Arylsulfotransferase (ASST)